MKLEQDDNLLIAAGQAVLRGETAENGPINASKAAKFSRPLAFLFAIACGLAVANVYFAPPLLDAIADSFGMSHATSGLIVSISQVGYGIGLLLIVPLGDLIDRRRLIAGQSVLSALALLAVCFAPTSFALLVAMASIGLLAVVTQALVAYAAGLAKPYERGQVVGIITSGIVLGILLARTIAGTMADLAGWRSVYAVSAVLTLVIAGLLFHFLPRNEAKRAKIAYLQLMKSVFSLFVEEPVLRIRAVIAMFIFADITMLLTPLVLPLGAPPFSLSHTQIGLFGLAGAAGALAASKAGGWADRGHAQRTTGIALAIMLLSWVPIAFMQSSLWFLIIGVVTIDFALQAVHVSNQSLIYRVRPEAQSRLTAGYMIFYSIGSAAGSLGSTLIYAYAGWAGVSLAGAGISLLALIFWVMTRHLTPSDAINRQG
ncbi:MFS transporter [Phyllobacterium sp. P30BS-XVII]|uniref:MFS transporter n=1 Tax=Phyllobacterium sp. P30BS-XVII TaxID=2587046 RepID=UPI0015FB97C4|nr:MFS transporter [Phyllobacterium sp. P30BS-XVII]MBA8901357.1 putative MFS family arabinose efflux permease [Phyllobacterium sp. P30BS-XVII]